MTLPAVSPTALVGTLGETLKAKDQHSSGALQLAQLQEWTDRPPLREGDDRGISDLARTLLRMFFLPEGHKRGSLRH